MTRLLSLLVFLSLLFHATLSVDPPSPSPSPLSDDSAISTPPSQAPSPLSDISSPPSQPPSQSPSPDSGITSPPTSSPSPSPSPDSSDIPPSDAPPSPSSSPSPSPSPDAADDAAQMESRAQTGDTPASSSKMNGGHKAGVAFGVIGAACVVGAAGWIYKKRQDNIRRTQYGYNTRTTMI